MAPTTGPYAGDRRGRSRLPKRKERASAPDARGLGALGKRDFGELIINRARELGFEAIPDKNSRGGPTVGCDDPERMVGIEDDGVAAVKPEGNVAIPPLALA